MKDFTSGPILKGILLFGLPLYLGNLLQQLYVLVDSIVVGQFLGTNAVAAIGAAQPVFYFFLSFFLGISIGFLIHIAHLRGSSDEEGIKKAIFTHILFTVGFTVFGLILSFTALDGIVALLQIPKELSQQVIQFLRILLLGMLPIFGLTALSCILRGLGDSKSPLVLLIVGSILNIVFVLLFVWYLKMDIGGAALGTVVSQAITMVASLIYVRIRYKTPLKLLYDIRFSPSSLRQAVKLGLPLALQHVVLAVGILVLIWILSPLGGVVMAGFTIVGRIEIFTAMPFLELSAALTTFVAQNYGAGNMQRIQASLPRVYLFNAVLTALISVAMIVFRDSISGIFSRDPEVIRIANDYIVCVYPFLILYTHMVLLHGVFNAVGKTHLPLICTIISFLLIRLTFSYFVRDHWGTIGLIYAVVVGWLIALVYSLFANRYQVQKHIAVQS